jgi:hypothetical protein
MLSDEFSMKSVKVNGKTFFKEFHDFVESTVPTLFAAVMGPTHPATGDLFG